MTRVFVSRDTGAHHQSSSTSHTCHPSVGSCFQMSKGKTHVPGVHQGLFARVPGTRVLVHQMADEIFG